MHMLRHRQVNGDCSLTDSHKRQQQCEAGDFLNQGVHALKHKECRKTRNLGNPSDILETQPSDTLRQKVYYERQAVNPLLEVLFAPILLEKLVHRQYHPGRDHEPVNTNSYSSSGNESEEWLLLFSHLNIKVFDVSGSNPKHMLHGLHP